MPPGERVKSWDRLVRETRQRGHPSYYHPSLVGRIEEIEMRCLREGRLFSEVYPTRYYWMEFGFVVGASRGEETRFLLVEHDASSGDVHGHPVTRDELARKGAFDGDD